MNESIFYSEANNAIINIFGAEFHNFSQTTLIKFLNYFSKLVHYEEEGLKVRPSLLFTNNINIVAKAVPNYCKIAMFNDPDDKEFNARMKALLYFCKNDWSVYVSMGDTIEYGLIKTLNSIKEKNFLNCVFEDTTKEALKDKVDLLSIEIISSNYVILSGIKGNKSAINFSLSEHESFNWEGVIHRFVEASVSKIKTTTKKLNELKIMYENIFHNAFKSVHGTICLVVDKDFKDTKGVLSDGIWLPAPIEMSKLFLQTKSYSEVKLLSYANLLIDMLNFDGVTVVDNAGRILAYNVFVDISVKEAKKLVGGARKRAAMSLVNSKNHKFVGVYFQSQDGDNFYEEVRRK